MKVTLAGGKRYIPIDLEASKISGTTVYQYEYAYEKRYKDYFRRTYFKLTYRINGKRTNQEWVIDIQNLSGHKNIFHQVYDPNNNRLKTEYQLGIFIVPQYRILF